MRERSIDFAGSSFPTRVGHVFVWLVVALFGLTFTYIFGWLAAQGSATAIIPLIVLGLPAVALPIWFAAGDTRRLRRGTLSLTAAGYLEVRYPAFFKSPLALLPAQIRKAAVDEGGLLEDSADRPRLPIVDASPLRIPNIALLFESPVPSPPLRDAKSHTSMTGSGLTGLLFHVHDLAQAREMLSEITECGGLDLDDLEDLEQPLSGDRLARRWPHMTSKARSRS